MASFLSSLRAPVQANVTEVQERRSQSQPTATHETPYSIEIQSSFAANLLRCFRRRRRSHPSNCNPNLDYIDELKSAGLTFDAMSLNEDNHRRKRQKLSPSKHKTPTCHFCCEDVTTNAWSRECRVCKVVVCHACMKIQFTTALRDHHDMPVRCCGKVVHYAVMENILPADTLLKYIARWDETQTPHPFYCPQPLCSAFIPPRDIHPTKGKIKCVKCETKLCVICRQAAKDNHKCTDDLDRQKITRVYGYKLCPKCDHGVMRMYGCNHVRCQCGAHWCYECRRPIDACNRNPCDQADESDDEDGTNMQRIEQRQTPLATENLSNRASENMPSIEHSFPPANENSPDEANIQSTNQDPSTEQRIVQSPAESVTNLDDPRATYWEAAELDFGDEPYDESHDIWGCHHNYRIFVTEYIPKRWLVGLDNPTKLETLPCLGCFKDTEVGTKTPSSKPKSDFKAGADVLVPPTDVQEGEDKRMRKQAAYECTSCGIIHCYACRRVAMKRLAAWKEQNGSP